MAAQTGPSGAAGQATSADAPKRAGLVLIALIVGALVCNINLSVANVALPDISASLGASQTQLTLIAVGCTLGLAMSVLYLGALGDRYGRKLLLMLGMLITLPLAMVSAWAPNPEVLIASRLLTGIAAGMAYPTTLALITALWSTGPKRTRAIALWSSVSAGAAILGPVIAGWLLEHVWWGSIFLIVVPVAITGLLLVGPFVPAHVNESKGRVDHRGGLLSVAMIGLLVLGISTISSASGAAVAVVMIVVALALIALFIRHERRAPNPLYDLRYAKRRLFWVPAVAGMIVFGSLMGSLFVGQQFMQNVLGYDTFAAGLAILPSALGLMLVARLSARLIGSRGSRFTLLLGFGFLIPGFILMLIVWKEGTPYFWVGLVYFLVGIGAGFALTPASQSLTASVPVSRVGMASGTTDLQRDLGGSIMQAVMGSLLTLGYASALGAAISTSSDASDVTASTQSALQLSFASAAKVAQQYPNYSTQIMDAAKSSFIDGANWAYAAGSIAAILGAALVAWRFPGKKGELTLAAQYAQQDAAGTGAS